MDQSTTIQVMPPLSSLKRPRRNRIPSIVGSLVLLALLTAAYFYQAQITQWFAVKKSETTEKILIIKQETTPTVPAPPANPIKERDLERYRAVETLRLALNSFNGANSRYPDRLTDLMPKFLTKIPVDPSTSQPYEYARTVDGFRIKVILEQGILTLAAGEHVLSPKGFDIPEAATTPDIVPPAPPPPPEVPVSTEQPEMPPASPTNDADNDGLSDYEESTYFETDPQKSDTDGDGFRDGDEVMSGYDPRAANTSLMDTDSDGLADILETARGYDSSKPDTDGDGLSDGDEIFIFGTSPTVVDTDSDGFSDGVEIAGEQEPLGAGPLTSARKEDIQQRQARYGLHPLTAAP